MHAGPSGRTTRTPIASAEPFPGRGRLISPAAWTLRVNTGVDALARRGDCTAEHLRGEPECEARRKAGRSSGGWVAGLSMEAKQWFQCP